MVEEEKTQAEEIEEQLAKKKAEQEKVEGKETSKEESSEEDTAPKGVHSDEGKEKSKKKKFKKERTGILYIRTTSNNTILAITDMAGNTIARSSGGQSTKQSRLKSSPTVAMFAAKKIGEEVKDLGIINLYVRVRAKTGATTTGSAPHAIVKSLSRDGFKILSIMEITRQPRGGPKQKGGRRGRRV